MIPVHVFMFQNSEFWRKCCEMEIHEDVRTDILNKFYPCWSEHVLENAAWRAVYKKWCMWQQFGKWAFLVRTSPQFGVTCVKASHDNIVTGHIGGAVNVWNVYHHAEGVQVTSHRSDVTDLGFILLKCESPLCFVQFSNQSMIMQVAMQMLDTKVQCLQHTSL